MRNLLRGLSQDRAREHFQDVLKDDKVRIERIVSYGQSSPERGWYDQPENEWVLVLEGSGVILFDDGSEYRLGKGDYLNIPAWQKHKVTRTDPQVATIWLAVFY